MPLYEYQCSACGHRFEVIQKSFSDSTVDVCPKCGGTVEKLVSSPAIQFKGSGFYITDYARKGSPESKEAKGESKEAKGASESKESSERQESSEKKSEGESTARKADEKVSPSSGTPASSSGSSDTASPSSSSKPS